MRNIAPYVALFEEDYMKKNASVFGRGIGFGATVVVLLSVLVGSATVRGAVTELTMADTDDWHFMAADGVVSPWVTLGDGSICPQATVDDPDGYYLKRAFYKIACFQDFTLEYDCKFSPYYDGTGLAGVIVRAQDWHSGYMVYMPWNAQAGRSKHAWVGVGRISETGYVHNLSLTQAVNVTSETDRWYHVKIELYGNRMKVWVDGRFVISIDDIFPEDGFIGLSGQSLYYFDNVMIDGEPLPASAWGDDTTIPRAASDTALSGPSGTTGTRYNVFPSACLTSSGDILIGSGGHIYRSTDHGVTWQANQVVGLSGDGVTIQQYTQMFMRSDDTLLLFHTEEVSLTAGSTVMKLRPYTSSDNGITWSPYAAAQTWMWTYDSSLTMGVYFNGPVVETDDGTITRLFYTVTRDPVAPILPAIGGREVNNYSWGASKAPKAFAIRSTDGGVTWSLPIEIDSPQAYAQPRNTISGSLDLTETTPVAFGNTVMATVRPVYSPQMWQCWSYDSGANWDAAVRTTFPGYAQSIVRLSSGAIVSAQRFPGYSMNVSWDDGLNWDAGTIIDHAARGMGCLVEAEPDVVICVYLNDGDYYTAGNMLLQRIRVTANGVEPADNGSSVVLSEDFMTYPGGTGIDDSTPGVNVNGWADWTATIVNDSSATPGVSGTFNPAQGLSVDYIGSLMPGLSTTPHPGFAGPLLGTEASAASVALNAEGVVTLDFDWALATATSHSGGPAGVQLVDSTNGKYVGWNTYSGSSWCDTSNAGSSGNYADPVGYFTDKQHVRLLVDFDGGTVTSTTSSDTILYYGDGFPYPGGGGHSITSSPLALPVGFEPDTVVLWNGGYEMNVAHTYGPGYDNIVVNQPNGESSYGRVCGDVGTEYESSDIDRDCFTDLTDFALFVDGWLSDTEPGN